MMRAFSIWAVAGCLIFLVGCGGGSDKGDPSAESNGQPAAVTEEKTLGPEAVTSEAGKPEALTPEDVLDLTAGQGPIELAAYEVQADNLLANALPPEKLEEGWVRLFDGHTLAGWSIVGQADWQCKDGVLRVTRGERSFLCTCFQIADYELSIEFRAGPKTNSGIFLRTAPQPNDAATDCLELNIAPPDNPFPTASMVLRERVEPETLGSFDPTQWHTYHVRLDGENVTVTLDGKIVLELVDDSSSYRGHISLQHNEGVVEFRNILMRPIASRELKLGSDWQEDWITAEKDAGTMTVEPKQDGLSIRGGLGKVQTKDSFGDFLLHTKYTVASPQVNSGIFFRCIPENMLDGYECQINHAISNQDPLRPSDGGAGGIFRRKEARIVVGDGTKPTYLTLLASGNQMVTWVNGLLTTEFYDSRLPDDNPRKGSRTQAGPIALQGHDPTTEITFHGLRITELR
jgi:hypothetical protein